jgi:hypothetical protein
MMQLRDDPELEVPDRCKVAWQLAAERAGMTLRGWLVVMGADLTAAAEKPKPTVVIDRAGRIWR